jgi:hypothetical protein
MAKGYKNKKRADKYEEKVSIDATFEDVIKIALGMNPENKPLTEEDFEKLNLKRGTFLFTQCDQKFPIKEHISTKGFNAVRITGKLNHGAIRSDLTIGTITESKIVLPIPGTNTINTILQLPNEVGFIVFKIGKVNEGQKEECSAEITFELINQPT